MTRAHFHPHPHPLCISNTATDSVPVSNPKQHCWVLHSKPKEVNLKLKHQAPPATEKMETASLAEELSGLRKKMERLRLDKEKTEKMLDGREGVLLLQMKEMEERGQIQRQLEIQVDRLFRLKELKSYCMRISPLKSLREKQRRGGWNINELPSLGLYCLRLILPLWWSTEKTIRKWIRKKLLSVGGYSTLSFDISYLSCTSPCCCCPKIVELC
ncbi:hypothetical protein V6N11_007235 [Hibiscus sabdariffa]|uniref:Uncharacterized protein n=1 Tax=Hibiscus sabdariffa TaxID=183260 RepID=A0ABR2RT58_9ROSI